MDDTPAMFEIYLRDPEVWGVPRRRESHTTSIDQARERIEHRDFAAVPGTKAVWLIGLLLRTPTPCSHQRSSLAGVRWTYGPEVEVGYHFGQFAWGKGYATEVTRGAIRHGFDELGLSTMCGVVFQENVASQRVLEKAGMTYRGLRSVFGFDGVMYYTIESPTRGDRPG